MKRKIGMAIVSMALVVSMSACGNSAALPATDVSTEVKTDTDQTHFNITGGQSALSPGYADNEVLNKMMEEAGIEIDWNTQASDPNASDDPLKQQVNIQIAGGDLPDAYMGVGFKNYELSNYGGDGTFIDLTPYITEDVMPNLTKILEEHPEIKAAITMDDGCIYGLPAGEQMGTAGIGKEEDYSIFTVPQFSMINKAWLDDLGLEVPTTLEQLHDVLVAFKENDMAAKMYGAAPGSTIPMSTGFDQWCWGQNVFYAGFGFTNWINDVCNDLVLDKDGKANFVCDDDNYREALTYFSDWYKEGLMDPEMFSQDTTQLMAKCQQGYVGVSTWWYIEELMGDYSKDYVFLPILTGPDGSSNVTVRTGGATNSGNLSITSACKSPVNLLKFFDLWYQGENVMQLQYGPIGVYFKEKDANGVWNSITDEQSKQEYGKSAGELKGYYEVNGPKLILSHYYKDTFNMEDRAIERLTDLYDFWMPQVKDTSTYPIDCVFTSEELETIDMYKTDFENTVAEQEGLWLKEGGPSDEEWAAYKDKLTNSCGMEELLKIYQDAYDRYAAAK